MADVESIIKQVLSYNAQADVDLIRRAFEFAENAHRTQLRLTGDPYIAHPFAAAEILADLEIDPPSIAAALLHDVMEDQNVSIEELKSKFGDEVAMLVDGVTKLKLADFDVADDEDEAKREDLPKKRRAEISRGAENLRKIFLAMARDFRVMVIKLADRLHNMMTLDGLPEDRRLKVARETMQIYAPLAHRLGIWKIKWALEDLAFKYIEPEAYADLSEKVTRTRVEREEDLAEATEMIQKHLAAEGIEAHIQARPKHLWSIYQKILREGVDYSEIYDLSAVRVIVDKVGDCYHVLGLVHDLWMPLPDRFSDYIAKPKSNMYKSLHTKVIGPRGEPLEIQIRTWEMHRVADFGVAAHWQYKEQKHGRDDFERKLSWLRQQLFDWQTDSKDAGEFLSSVVNDLFTDQVFVFTPRGDVIDLPAGSTPLDFAYRIHSDVGHHCVGGKVNGRIVPLSYKLSNNDIVEVITRTNSQPSMDWLSFVVTSHARNKIRGHFRKLHFSESSAKGRELLEKELERQGLDVPAMMKSDVLAPVFKSINLQTDEDMFAAIGNGYVAAASIVNKLKGGLAPAQQALVVETAKPSGEKALSVNLHGLDTLRINRAKCCMPLPGEEVVGYVTRGKGVTLHSTDCPNLPGFREREPERLVQINWLESDGERYATDIFIKTFDSIGVLNAITAIFSEGKISIRAAKVKSMPDKTSNISLTVEVPDVDKLKSLLEKVGNLPDVLNVERVSDHKMSKGAQK
jgi:GTP pyrophosphokinase